MARTKKPQRESEERTVKLSNGQIMPRMAFGTWKLERENCAQAIHAALDSGFRHIDCAQDYLNEDAVGDALKEAFDKGTVSRNEVFITSKLANPYHDPEHVMPQLRKSLKDLQLDHLDLFLMHWPIAMSFVPYDENRRGYDDDYSTRRKDVTMNTKVSIRDTWQAMEKCLNEGLVRSIGVSNFPVVVLHDLLSYCQVCPVVNQVELHPYLQQDNLIRYCRSRDIVVMGYSSLGSGSEDPSLLEDQLLCEIAENLKTTPAQLSLAWNLTREVGVIVKSSDPSHIAENEQAWKIHIDDDTMKRIAQLERGHRYLRPECLSTFDGVPLFD